MWNLVSPIYSFSDYITIGIEFARWINDIEGMREYKKRMASCNDVHRGSKFAPT